MTRWLSFFGILLAFLAPGRRAPAAERAPAAGAGPRAIAGSLRTARALRARSRDYLAAAVSEYQALLRRSPHHLEAERGLARALRDQGAEEAALPYLRDVADRSRLGVDEARLGWALFRAGHWAEAADAFVNARQRGQNDPETVRGAALAATAARAALDVDGPPEQGAASRAAGSVRDPLPGGWQRAWAGVSGVTGFITHTVQRLLLGIIALLIAGGVVLRVWSTLMGRAAPRDEGGMPWRRLRKLRIREIATGRRLGRVRRAIYDPKLARVVGFQTEGRFRPQVIPLAAARGLGPGGLLLADAGAMVPFSRAGELAVLARAGVRPLGPGSRLRRVVTEEGALLGFTRPHRLRIDGASGRVTFEVTPNRFHDAYRVALAVLQFGPVDWLMGLLLDWGLELLPGRLSARVRLPVDLIRSADRDVVIVSPEAVEWIEQHFLQIEADAHARLAQVKEGVARAKPLVEAGVARAKPVVQAGVEKAKPAMKAGVARARPVLARARDHGPSLARRSAEAVAGRKAGQAGGEGTGSSGDPPLPPGD